ncbi:MAG: CBS domain-containing protein [Proteobacteria bacterium]|nr:CBS domain-containing protein [Pseudomonadota bacterium]
MRPLRPFTSRALSRLSVLLHLLIVGTRMTNRNDDATGAKLKRANEAIAMVCHRSVGVVDTNFLCQTIGGIRLPAPLCVSEETIVSDALAMLKEARAGCLLVVAASGAVSGIFSERDCLLKVVPDFEEMSRKRMSEIMTRDPVTQTVDCTIGFALTLMSEGGFRHIPIVDDKGHPISLLSVKEVMDHIVARFIDDALAFDTASSDARELLG